MKLFNIENFKTKSVRFGGYATLVTVAVLIGIILLNLIVGQVPAQLDMTEKKLYSLSEQTMQVLEDLQKDVTIYALYQTGRENDEVLEVVRKYARASDNVSVEVVDPDLNPGFVSQYDETGEGIPSGSIIVASDSDFKVINNFDLYDVTVNQQGQRRVMGFAAEQRVTGAILYVGAGYTPVIYELTGHNEFTLEEYGLTDILERENYEIRPLNLLTEDEVPADISVLVVTSPKFDITEGEMEKIRAYLENDGKAMLFFDVMGEDLPVWDELLHSYGVEIEEGVVMEGDTSRFTGNPLTLAPILMDHEILEPIKGSSINVITQQVAPVMEYERTRRNVVVEPLLTSSNRSWIRTNFQIASAEKTAQDTNGPANISVAVRRQKELMSDPEGYRLVVTGTSRMLGPVYPYGTIKGNVDFFMNSLSWVNFQEQNITVRSKSLFRLPLRMTQFQVLLYTGIFVILVPVLILGAGLFVWLRRRHL